MKFFLFPRFAITEQILSRLNLDRIFSVTHSVATIENKIQKNSPNTLLFAALTAVFAVFFWEAGNVEAAINGVLRVHPANQRYFTDNSGKAIYLTGSHTWSNFVEEPTETPDILFDYPGYLDFLAANNHNFIRFWSFMPQYLRFGVLQTSQAPLPWARTGGGTAKDGKPKFNLTQFNQTYFDRLRSRTIAARDHGIYVSVMLFEGWCLAGQELGKDRECWTYHPFNAANNSNGINADANGDGVGYEFYTSAIPTAAKDLQKAYIRKVVDTVNDLDNVLYEIVNEATPKSVSWQYEIINYLKSYEATKAKKHPVGMTTVYTNDKNTEIFNSPADWISPGNLSNSTLTADYRNNPPANDGTKIILLDTDHLWGIGGDRVWIWKSFTRGLNPIYMDLMELLTDTDPARSGARKAMGHTLTYANTMNLAAMTPSSSPSDCSTTYCLKNPGREYLVYQPAGGSFTANLPAWLRKFISKITKRQVGGAFTVDLPAGDYNYEWFNPATGLRDGTGTATAAGGNESFTPPPTISGDAVLYLIRKSAATPPASITEDN